MDMLLWKRLITNFTQKITNVTRKLKREKENVVVNEVLIYGSGDDDEDWKKQVGLNNLYCILHMIVHAERTIDISMPRLESDSIAKCLINRKRNNGVVIRVIVHAGGDLCNLHCMADNDISVKVIDPKVKLQHEFILIDGQEESDAVAIMGSLDFEINRVNCSRDTTILTSDPALTRALQREFDRVWNTMDSNLISNTDDSDESS